MTKYVALSTVHYNDDATGERMVATAFGNGHHGVFEGLSAEDARDLLKLDVIREATMQDVAKAHMAGDFLDSAPVAAAPVAAEPIVKKGVKGKDKPADGSDDEDLGL